MPVWSRGEYNAEGSFDYFLHANLSAVTASFLTAWVTTPEQSAMLRFHWLDAPLRPPCFTVTHLEQFERDPGQQARIVTPQGNVGAHVRHITEVSVWHSRYSAVNSAFNPNWPRQLRQLAEMVPYLFQSGAKAAPLLDLNSATAAPFTTAGIIRFVDLRAVSPPPDPNPAFIRRRFLWTWDVLQFV